MTLHNCRWCNEKYAHPRSAERCCTYKAVQISKEDIPKPKSVKLTPEEIKINRKKYYQKNKESILAKQKVLDNNRKNRNK